MLVQRLACVQGALCPGLLVCAFLSWPEDRVLVWLRVYHERARATGLPVPDMQGMPTEVVTKAEARGSWRNARTDIGATYIWLDKDPRENRPDTISEWAIDGSYRFADHWTASGEWRFDTSDQRSIRAGAGITYTNECVEITFSVSRRFTSSAPSWLR